MDKYLDINNFRLLLRKAIHFDQTWFVLTLMKCIVCLCMCVCGGGVRLGLCWGIELRSGSHALQAQGPEIQPQQQKKKKKNT